MGWIGQMDAKVAIWDAMSGEFASLCVGDRRDD